jgi:zinc transport system substrate-binding protein
MKIRSKIQNPKSKIVNKKTATLILILCFAILLSIFASTGGSQASEKLAVFVVNYPLKYFAERIGGDHVNVVFPAPSDEDPAFWGPDVKTISAYQKADLILLNGAGYAKWVNKVSLPRFRLVNTSANFKDRYIVTAEILTHSHGAEGKHAHESLAFTTWMDPELAAMQAKAIADALTRKNPRQRDAIQKNYRALETDLIALDRDIKAVVSKDPSRPLLVSHPVYDYFARRYGLNIKSVHWEPDEIPNNEQWVELRAILKGYPARWMIWEGEPIGESVERLKSIGVHSLVFDPCGNVPDRGDFLTVMRQNVENLKLAFQ